MELNGTYLQLYMDGMPMALFQCTVQTWPKRQTDRHGDSPPGQSPAVFSVKSHKKHSENREMNKLKKP